MHLDTNDLHASSFQRFLRPELTRGRSAWNWSCLQSWSWPEQSNEFDDVKNKLWWNPQQQWSLCHAWLHGPLFLRSGFAHVDNVVTGRCSKQSHGCSAAPVKVAAGTVWNLPTPASGNYTSTRRNSASGTYIVQRTPELAGTLRNRTACLPPEPTPAHAGTPHSPPEPSGTFRNFWNLPELEHAPEPSGTCLRNLRPHTGTFRNLPDRNLHHHTPEPSKTFRNLPEPTFRNLPEPAPVTSTGTHRSLSGLKTLLAYAVGEKENKE